jgi:molybdate transport system substrate-binding protein
MGISGQRTMFATALMLVSLSIPSRADDVRVIAGNALRAPLEELGKAFSAATGEGVVFTLGSPGQLSKHLDDGERFDVLIVPSSMAEALDRGGKLAPGTRKLVRIGVGVAARAGGPQPALSSAAAFKRSLLSAKKVTYSDSSTGGLSGVSVQNVLANLGITEEIKANAVLSSRGQDLVASGEADFGLFNISEIPRAKGVILAGAVPREAQAYLAYDVALPIASDSRGQAAAFVAFVSTPQAASVWDKIHIERVAD